MSAAGSKPNETSAGPELESLPKTDTAPARDTDPLIGRCVNGRFTILSIIARGGMGKVYRARQAPLGRICALKVLSPRYADDDEKEFERRFFLEAATAAKLTHANTVTIFDYGRDEDILYIAMEFVQGRTLYQVLREDGCLPEDRVAAILREVGRSLREAHAMGVVHRDMKPANVVLVEGGEESDNVKVLDFGLVKDLGNKDTEDLTQQGLFMGSPKYMAPEQILGGDVSPCTDIYALGIVACELLTGRVPFDETTSVKTLMAHVNDPVPPLHELNPDVRISAAMRAVVACCLQKEPEDRYEDVNALMCALTDVEGGGTLTESLMPGRRVEVPTGGQPRVTVGDGSGVPSSSRTTAKDQVPPPSEDSNATTVPLRHMRPSETPAPMAQELLDEPSLRSFGTRYVLIGLALVAMVAAVLVLMTQEEIAPAPAAEPSAPVAATAAPAPPAPPPAETATTTAVPTATSRTVAVRSTPAGATVREGTEVLCEATPCSVTWQGAAAGREAKHALEVTKSGYELGRLDVPAEAKEVTIALQAQRGAPRVLPPTPATAAPATTTAAPKTPAGYKDSPY